MATLILRLEIDPTTKKKNVWVKYDSFGAGEAGAAGAPGRVGRIGGMGVDCSRPKGPSRLSAPARRAGRTR